MAYDFNAPSFVEHYDELPLWSANFGQLLLEHVPLRDHITALDVGCGTGFPLLELAQRLGPTSRVYGLDPWFTALTRADRKRRQWRVANASAVSGDAASMPFASHSFDLIVSNLGVNNFADARASLAECRRVLRPDGTLALTTNLVGHMREFYEVFAAVLGPSTALDAHIHHRATVDSLRSLLATAGFTVTRVVEKTFTMRYASGSALFTHDFVRFGFLPGWAAVAGEEVLEEVARRLPSPLTLTIPCAYVEAH